MALLSLAVAAAGLCVSESWSLAPCCSSWPDAYWHSPSGPGPPSSSSALQQLDSGGKSTKEVQTLWVPKGPQKAMTKKWGGKATGSHLNASLGCSLFRGPYSTSTKNSPPYSAVHTKRFLLLSPWAPQTLEHCLAVLDKWDSPCSLPLISHLFLRQGQMLHGSCLQTLPIPVTQHPRALFSVRICSQLSQHGT